MIVRSRHRLIAASIAAQLSCTPASWSGGDPCEGYNVPSVVEQRGRVAVEPEHDLRALRHTRKPADGGELLPLVDVGTLGVSSPRFPREVDIVLPQRQIPDDLLLATLDGPPLAAFEELVAVQQRIEAYADAHRAAQTVVERCHDCVCADRARNDAIGKLDGLFDRQDRLFDRLRSALADRVVDSPHGPSLLAFIKVPAIEFNRAELLRRAVEALDHDDPLRCHARYHLCLEVEEPAPCLELARETADADLFFFAGETADDLATRRLAYGAARHHGAADVAVFATLRLIETTARQGEHVEAARLAKSIHMKKAAGTDVNVELRTWLPFIVERLDDQTVLDGWMVPRSMFVHFARRARQDAGQRGDAADVARFEAVLQALGHKPPRIAFHDKPKRRAQRLIALCSRQHDEQLDEQLATPEVEVTMHITDTGHVRLQYPSDGIAPRVQRCLQHQAPRVAVGAKKSIRFRFRVRGED